MIDKRKIGYILGFMVLIMGFFVIATNVAYAGDYNIGAIAEASGLKKGESVAGIIGQIIGAILSFVGVIFFVLMIYGGIMWMTSAGNEQRSGDALKTIISAVVGMIIVLSAYIFVSFIFKLTSAEQAGPAGSGAIRCRDEVPGLGQTSCTADTTCTTLKAGLRCNNATSGRQCQAQNESFCPTQCGEQFRCVNVAQCEPNTSVRFYCPEGNDNVCCVPRTAPTNTEGSI